MKFGSKLMELRREKGYSQEQLAWMLGVSRQSVSKWEADASMPEISKILQLSDIFMVTTDYLLKESIEERQYITEPSRENFEELGKTQARILEKLEKMEEDQKETVKEYEYISSKKLFGLPLIHIHFRWTRGYRKGLTALHTPGAYLDFRAKAKGIIAIGNNATGLFSIGLLAKGIISLGLFSFGLFAAGCIGMGLIALGVIALGGLAAGVTAIGYVAMGVAAIGIYGAGVSALAGKAAVGTAAVARTAAGREADGIYVMILDQLTGRQEVRNFLMEHQPDMPGWILDILTRAADLAGQG